MIDNVFDYEGKPIQCKELSASFGMFCSEKSISFQVDDLEISVVQSKEIPIARQIKIVAKKDVAAQYLYDTFVKIAMLIMLAEGSFPKILDIKFNLSSEYAEQLSDLSKKCTKRIPPFFNSSDITYLFDCQLLDIDSVLNADIFRQWKKILEEADIMHNIFLSVLSNGLYGNDLKLAFMVETAESMSELVRLHNLPLKAKNSYRRTCLMKCIDSLITSYGQDIFSKEFNNNIQNYYSDFLQRLVNSRVRIMHIKRKYEDYLKKHYPNIQNPILHNIENILYIMKLSLLYRRIMLELLGVPYTSYFDSLKNIVDSWEKWYDKNK